METMEELRSTTKADIFPALSIIIGSGILTIGVLQLLLPEITLESIDEEAILHGLITYLSQFELLKPENELTPLLTLLVGGALLAYGGIRASDNIKEYT